MKRQANKENSFASKYILLIMTIICIVFILVGYAGIDVGSRLSTGAGYIFVPMEKGLNYFGTWIYSRSQSMQTLEELKNENESLKLQIEALESEIETIKMDAYELDTLRDLYDFDQKYQDYEKVGATVVAKASGSWFSTFTIDKGRNHGLSKGMNVVADGGLVGVITECGRNFSTVRSIIDDSSNVSAMVLSTGDNCIVSGNIQLMTLSEKMAFSELDDDDDVVNVGAKVVVSNISDLFVPGLPIGYISSVEYNSNEITKTGTITPIVDFKHLTKVLVITQKKEVADDESEQESADSQDPD